MKFSGQTLRRFTSLHSWVGLIAGFALFVAFYAGAITVFHHDLPMWQTPPQRTVAEQTLADAQQLLDAVLTQHPTARQHIGMLFPGAEAPRTIAYWQDADGTWLYAWPGQTQGHHVPPQAGLAELVNALHYSLGLPVVGVYLLGIVSLLYGVAILSGLVIHLPRLAKDLFALRTGANLKQFWQDAHNIAGVLSLPFHLMFAVTGALLCLLLILTMALDPLIYGRQLSSALPAALDTAPIRAPAGIAAPAPQLPVLHAQARAHAAAAGVADFEPVYLKLANAGDAKATIEITGHVPGALGPLGAVALDVSSGNLLRSQLPPARDANHTTVAATYALHFGEYGNALVPVLYFLLGLSGAFVFYSGNVLWIESRRKRRHAEQPRRTRVMARATIGVCIGLCVAISTAFVAAQVAERLAPAWVDAIIHWSCFLSWGICVLWAACRTPAQAARELLALAASITALVPLAHGLCTGRWLWRSALEGQWPLFWIDLVAVLMAWGFAMLSIAASRRARAGTGNSVWADPTPENTSPDRNRAIAP